jgi:sigma-E factor negative regulatory protein RseA
MSKETREHISCLMDGEISRETSRFLVRRLGADAELSATWARYHLVRDCLRHPDSGQVHADLCSRVSSAIAAEGRHQAPPRIPRRWLRPVAGMAVAASVALMAVVLVAPIQQDISDMPAGQPGALAETSQPERFTSPQSLAPAPASRQVSLAGRSAGSQRMHSYLLRHYQATDAAGGKGFVTFVPIVSAATPANEASDDPSTEQTEAADQASEQ